MDTIFIDVREPYEFSSGHVKGALNIPPADIMQGLPPQLKDTPKDTEIVLYCRSGARSNMSMQFLRKYGFTNLVNGINQDHVEANYF
ncbi:MAG TPA: rhodanese-like domain-containing protein [Candidatus Saccharibacteria bacterium]|nr:rhodanese-like domain-containing protein [Candidatus Saccharibacteria bacterium]